MSVSQYVEILRFFDSGPLPPLHFVKVCELLGRNDQLGTI